MLELPFLLQNLGLGLLAICVYYFGRNKCWRTYPFFSAYLSLVTIRVIAIFLIEGSLDRLTHSYFFWYGASLMAALRMAVVWEVLRQLFPRGNGLRSVLNGLSLTLLTLLALLFWRIGPEGDLFSDIERKLSLTSATWILLTVGAALYFQRAIPRPVWGMAAGIGYYTTVSLLNFVVFGLIPTYSGTWALIRQSSFSMLMGFFIWGLLQPSVVAADALARPPVSSEVLLTWNNYWLRIRAVVGDVFGR